MSTAMKQKKLSPAALDALATAVVENNIIRIPSQLDRPVYVEVNKALESLGGKWSRKVLGHVFDRKDDLRGVLASVLQAQGYVDKKKELQQFFTPAALADLLVKLADVRPGHRVLEPSAGIGHIVDAVRRAQPSAKTVAVEVDPEHTRALNRMLNHDMGALTALIERDFLTIRPGGISTVFMENPRFEFDRVIMNPPFAKGQGIEHVMHAWKFLAPGGRLAAILDAGVSFRGQTRDYEFRHFVKEHSHAGLFTRAGLIPTLYEGAPFYEVPARTFAESGTNVSTVIVVLEKP